MVPFLISRTDRPGSTARHRLPLLSYALPETVGEWLHTGLSVTDLSGVFEPQTTREDTTTNCVKNVAIDAILKMDIDFATSYANTAGEASVVCPGVTKVSGDLKHKKLKPFKDNTNTVREHSLPPLYLSCLSEHRRSLPSANSIGFAVLSPSHQLDCCCLPPTHPLLLPRGRRY